MALPATLVWEVQTGGSDTNGGAFDAGGSGTDKTYTTSSPVSRTDIVIDGATDTDITSAGTAFDSTDVDNIINITSGTGFTTGRYRIVSESGGVATLDRAVGTVASTGGNGTLGGALASWGEVMVDKVAGNDVFIKAVTYTITTSSTNVSGGPVLESQGGASQTNVSKWEGYQTTRGDLGTKPILSAGSVGSITLFDITATYVLALNLAGDGNGQSSITGFRKAAHYTRMGRISMDDSSTIGIVIGNHNASVAWDLLVENFSGTVGIQVAGIAFAVEARNGTTAGIEIQTRGAAINFLSHGNTGASSHGAEVTSVGGQLINGVVHGNGGDGVNLDGNAGFGSLVANVIAQDNSGEGFGTDGVKEGVILLNCAGQNNTGGDFNATNITNVFDFVTGSADFFTDDTNEDFSLNKTAGGGADARAAGFPAAFPGGNTTGFPDIGAAQHQVISGPGILKPLGADSFSEF